MKQLPKATLYQFTLEQGLLYFVRESPDCSLHYSLIVPSGLTSQAIRQAHELVGHLGQKKTIKKTEELFYWPNLKSEVCHFVKQCVTCQRFKGEKGLEQQWKDLPAVSQPLERLGLDLTEMVAGNHGYRYSFTIIDHYSRYMKFFILKTKQSPHITQALDNFIADYGQPRTVVADNGGEFVNRELQNFCQKHHITIYYTTPYHPQGNGVTERLHRTLKLVLATLCQGHPPLWPHLLQSCQIILNQAVHTSTG